ncbi:hypothetical protein RND81_05G077400 [Saponaria officinalis]|uniref:Uncharacterized protein n=1 Tax=Saponaria officinalis TaxID=3572 RepID=A0AAW1KVX3_SAPOF
MASWSPENATKAYITTLKMERKEKEPDSAEFISALAAGNNAQKMIIICTKKVNINNILALVAAANQTGGLVNCILPDKHERQSVQNSLKSNAKSINFIVDNNASEVLTQKEYYKETDFLLVDCNIQDYDQIMRRATKGVKKGGVVVGFNAFCKGSSWQWGGLRTHLLPIGDGLLVTKINDGDLCKEVKSVRKSNWIVKVDQCTGEEHVFRVRSSQSRKLQVSV